MKQRFSSLDVRAMSHELSRTLANLRIQNIHDLSSRIFLFRFNSPTVGKLHLIVDTGFRCHLTNFGRTTASEPSPFVKKLRKLLGTRRVTSISQVGTDRIIRIQFSDGLYNLFLEFYAAGNIVVADKDLTVLALFRTVSDGAEHEWLKLGSKYELDLRQNYNGSPGLTLERIRSGLEAVVAQSNAAVEGQNAAKSKRRKAGSSLRKALSQYITEFPPALVEHALRLHNLDSSITPEKILDSAELLDQLLAALKRAQDIVAEITSAEKPKGYIMAKKNTHPVSTAPDDPGAETDRSKGLLYDDYQPFKPKQFEDDPEISVLEFDSFNRTVDDFYSSIEGQRLGSKLQEREQTAKRKLAEAQKIQNDRLGALQQTQALNIRKAEAIQANMDRVREATAAVNGLIAQGMDWVDIGRLIEAEQGRGNPVAQLVKLPLKLQENTITLLLAEPEDDDEDSGYHGSDMSSSSEDEDEDESNSPARSKKSGSQPDRRLTIDIELSLSPWANASQYYDQKKSAAEKEEKTAKSATTALKSAERKINADLKRGLKQEKDVLRPLRQTFWFEKFYFFISSDGHLVLAGKDVQQNETLYNKYLKKGDVFVHADIIGASTVIIKNNPTTPDAPIPPSTLSQAGTFAVSTSSAWDSKALMAAWWVPAQQVSKLAPTGDYLAPGLFHISGEKNFLPPAQLLVGIAVVFQISEASAAQHKSRRATDLEEINTADQDEVKEAENEKTESEDKVEVEEGDEEFLDSKQLLEDDSEEEDFPDTKPALEDSDEEDFPDSTPAKAIESDEEDEEPSTISNPLQTEAPTVNIPERSIHAIPDSDDDATSVAVTEMTIGGKSTRRHLSAKERRLLKKGVKPEDIKNHLATPSLRTPANEASTGIFTPIPDLEDLDMASDMRSVAGNDKNSPLPRGKRTKQKKAATKYGDQDEDERQAALARIGSNIGADRRAAELQAKKKAELDAAAQKQRRREQHLRTQALGRLAEQARQAEHKAERPGADAEDANEPIDLSMLSALIGRPHQSDTIVAAVPLCAPWTALASYKYKTKLQPGAVKKGKAAREVLGKWQADAKVPRNVDPKGEDPDRVWPREAEMIAGVRDVDVIAVVPVGKVRVMTGAGPGSGAAGGKGAGGGGKGKGKAVRGGKGSKRK